MAINAMTTFANREVYNLIICDFNTQKPILNIDWANATSNSITGEAVFAYGGWQHPKRVTFYGEKGGTLTLETQIQSYQLYSIMTGASVENTGKFLIREVLAGGEGSLTAIKGTPIDGTVSIFAEDDDCGTPIECDSVSDKTITASTVTSGKNYIVYYMNNYSDITKISITNTTVPKACTIYGNTLSKTESDLIVSQRMIAYKATPQQEVSWSYSNTGDPATLSITFDLLVDQEGRMLDLLTIEDEQ